MRTKFINENNLYKPTPENLRGTTKFQLLVVQMDADEHRLNVDLYLGEFVFICGFCRRLRYEAYTLREFFV